MYKFHFKRQRIKFEVVYENIDKNTVLKQPYYIIFQVFNNLIQNAINALNDCKNKQIIIIISWENQETSMILFKICDTGIGILPQNQTKIFNLGFSTRNSSGLGLSHVRHVLSLHGGDVQLGKITPPFSTIFEVKLPQEII